MATPTKFVGQTYTPAEMVALYQQAEAEIIATGQSKAIRGKTLTKVNLGDVRDGIVYWQKRDSAANRTSSVATSRHPCR